MKYILANGSELHVETLSDSIFRLRLRKPFDRESGMNRYGMIEKLPDYDCEAVESDGFVTLHTGEATLTVRTETGDFELTGRDGKRLVSTARTPRNDHDGFALSLSVNAGARLYGLGDVTRDRIEKRGYETDMWVRNVTSYVPIPFLMSSDGWGIYLNCTWRHHVDVCAHEENVVSYSAQGGELDYYLFAGRDLAALLKAYTDLLGKPVMLPRWAYGLVYVCNQNVNDYEMMQECLNFRREGIPCDVVGLEPGWMSKRYDYSTEKQWDPEKFYIPFWAPKGEQTFFGAIDRLGFKLSLWLCCNYDLSFEEEKIRLEKKAESGADDFEQDQHFAGGKLSMDKTTKIGEPWFEHLKKFVDQGARCFKLDGADQIVEHPDRKWGNGMDDEEMHNLYPLIYDKQMSRGFSDYTGLRSMIYSASGYAGVQKFCATWAGDTGGGPKPLVSMLNHGLSGHNNTSCDMDIFSNAGIHFGFFQPWSQLCNWAYWRQPWFLQPERKEMYRFYARLRYRLLPYIYTAAHQANATGYPIMRAMPLVFPDMPGADSLLNEYMLGDALLTAAFADQMTLPEGRWIDAWRDMPVDGGRTMAVDFPDTVGGPLYVREGSIIPCCEPGEFIGQKPIETISLNIYPADSQTVYTLYEDDGETLAYQKGECALTEVACVREGKKVRLCVGERQGHYDGMPEKRDYIVNLHQARVLGVSLNGRSVPFEVAHDTWCGHSEAGVCRFRMDGAGEAQIEIE